MVQKEDIESAIKLGNYFLEHARYAFDQMGGDAPRKQALALIEKIKATSPRVTALTARDAMRLHRPLANRYITNKVLDLLIDYEYLRTNSDNVGQKRKNPTFEVNPAIYDEEHPS